MLGKGNIYLTALAERVECSNRESRDRRDPRSSPRKWRPLHLEKKPVETEAWVYSISYCIIVNDCLV